MREKVLVLLHQSTLTLEGLWTYFAPCSIVSIVTFEQVNADWVVTKKCLLEEELESNLFPGPKRT